MTKRLITKSFIIIFILHLIGFGSFYAYKKNIFAKKEKGISITNVPKSEFDSVPESDSDNITVDQAKPDATSKDANSEGTKSPIGDLVPKTAPKTEDKNPVQAEQKTSDSIVQKPASFGFQTASSRTIKAIIVHTSYNALGGDVFDFAKVLQEWKGAGVSPHYAIDKSGTTYQLVADKNIAWHAGASKLPDGTTDVNGASIGIEVVNDKNSKFSDAQYSSLNRLIGDLKKKYPIKYVLGHDDIAPGRKTDPWGIYWNKVNR